MPIQPGSGVEEGVSMNGRSCVRVSVAVIFSFAFAPDGRAQTPAGGEFRVNTYTTSAQRRPAVAKRANGDFVITWHSNGPDGSGYGVRDQRYSATGAALGGEFAVNTYTVDYQYWPKISANARGTFVVTWSSYGQDGSYWGAFGRKFDAIGGPLGAEFQVNTYTTGYQFLAQPAMAANGSFVVVWNSFYPGGQDGSGGAVIGRRYDATGAAVGGEFIVNTYTTGEQSYAAVGATPAGSFVVAWQSPQDGNGYGIVGRRFDAGGNPVGAEFVINSTTTGDQIQPAVAVNPNGSFVVSFHSPDGSSYGVRARLFDANAAAVGADFAVNTYTTGSQYGYTVSADAQGNFVVSWASATSDGSGYAVSGQRFRADGARRGAEFRVNTYTTGVQSMAAVASDAVGNFDVSWRSVGQDGSLSGVYAQRFGGLLSTALRVDTPGGGGTGNGNLVWEPTEAPDVRPTWRNVNGVAQTIGAGLTNITGPAGPTYTVLDGAGNYGTMANNASVECTDCYRVSVSGTRPSVHWDASAVETLTPDTQGQQKTWRLHIGASFSDVPTSNPFYRFIETLLHVGITGGCSPTQYCPGDSTTREQMAVFVLVAKEGAGFVPPACTTPIFLDVPASSPFCRFIEELSRRGVVSGCGGGNYCPFDPVTREQMSVFVLLTLDPALNPPACTTPVFNDVPASSPFCRFIEELARRGVVAGCGGGNYCPFDPVSREQMGVFIGVTFGLTLYGP
jgi:hypothetical protein